MSKKKLSILIDWYLPGTKAGGPVRSIYSLITLLKNEFDVYLITTNKDLGSEDEYKNVKANEWITKEGVNYFYFSKDQLSKENLKKLLLELNSDVIYLNSFWSYWFSIFIVQLKNQGELRAEVVLAPRGMLGKGALNIKSLKKKIYITLSKAKNFYKNIHFHATNVQEENDIKHFYPKAFVNVLENVNNSTALKVEKEKKPGQLSLFYLSRISKVKNLHFALDVLSKVEKYLVEYTIYGNIEDETYWKECQQQIKELPSHVKVNYKGELPFHEVQKTIAQHHYLFLPTTNENYGHSIVESLMSSCPVIISDQTPWNDVEKNEAGFALNLDHKGKFIKTIEECAAQSNTEYKKQSEAALNYITKKINLSLINQKYIQLFNGKH
ncbi:MAG: glycosyltransferase [Sphingobacteriaceae bacterium]|nr:glycosyltransferase [Sphingobacteriaceae bacterium]